MTGDTITLQRMRFHVRVGILPHERELAQPLEVDLAVVIAPAFGQLRVDYRELHAATASVVEDGPHEYIETIAERIAAGALAIAHVTVARVAVRKPMVALPGPLDYAEVRIERTRDA
ncbi:MAG: dihydroneopterin aldolase [Gemmatimonadetes bacterium]|nr:dihydroneopterin aldolase [Gemmatimonadota bacterium]